jgi:ribosomal protein S18 acetylase RimI-like enzyme
LAAFAARTFAETFGADNDPVHLAEHLATAYGEPQQRRELTDPSVRTLLVDQNGVLCGYAQVRRKDPPPCVTGPDPIEIARFYIDRPWQGHGLAQRLMTAAQKAAQEGGGRTLWLGVWERNPRAIAFYIKSGFQDVGSADFWVGPDRQTDRILVTTLHPSPP